MDIIKWLKGIFCRCELIEVDRLKAEEMKLKAELLGCNEAVKIREEEIAELVKKELGTPFEQFLDRYPKVNLIYTKRWIFNKDNTYQMDVRDFLRCSKTLPEIKTLEKIYTFPIQYIYDDYQKHGTLDYYQLPEETYKLKGGDCEDSSSFRCALAKQAGFDVALALGFIGDVGHAFTLWMDGDKIYILESTTNKFNPIHINGAFPDTERYKVYYIITQKQAYQIRSGVQFGEQVRTEFGIKKR